MFSVLAGIIPLSLRNGEGAGAFDTVCPPCLQVGGNCPLCPPPTGSAAAYAPNPTGSGYCMDPDVQRPVVRCHPGPAVCRPV